MKKSLMALITVVFLIFTASGALAVATIGAELVKINMADRSISVKMKSGTVKNARLVQHAKAYILNEPADFRSFQAGQYVVLKISNPVNEEVWQVEVLMDAYSARQYTAYHSVTPIVPKNSAGGYATSGGASTINMPPLTGVYPNAISNKWPNDSKLPPNLAWGTGTSTLKAHPSPWASPAMGAVLSGSPDANSASVGNPDRVTVDYDTGPAAPGASSGTGSVAKDNLGIVPDQGNWAAKPTGDLPTKMLMDIQGRIRQYDAGYSTLYVQDLNKPEIYTVVISAGTKILDYMTGGDLTAEQLKTGLIVKVLGTGGKDKVIRASRIRIQR